MKQVLRALCLLAAISIPLIAQAEIRTFREVNGRSHTGTFQKVQGDKVHLRVRNKTSLVSFWSLTKADQLYVLEQAKSDPLVATTLKAAEDPRDWTDTRGNKTSARFIEVKAGATIVLAIDGNKSEFRFENFSKADQDYVRNQVRGTDAATHLPEESAQNPNPIPQPGLGNRGGANLPGFPQSIPNATTTPSSPPPGHNAVPPAAPGIAPGFPNSSTLPPAGHSAMPTGTPATTIPMPSTVGSVPGHSAISSIPIPSTAPASKPIDMDRALAQMHAAAQPPVVAPNPPSSTASRPGPYGSPDMVAVYRCSNCNKEVAATATKCPHCSTQFDYVEDENGKRTETSYGSSRSFGKALKAIVVIGIGIGGWLIRKLNGNA